MNKIIYIVAIAAFLFFQAIISPRNSRHLLVSFFIIATPFEFTVSLINEVFATRAGTLGTRVYLSVPIILFCILFPIYSFERKDYNINLRRWTWIVLMMLIVSLFNPFNSTKFATIAYAFFFLSHILFFKLIFNVLTKEEIIKGAFKGFLVLCCIQFLLSLCFPLLNIYSVTTLFHEGAAEAATRSGTRIGAIGTFTHPGNLALYTTIASSFFFSCYLSGYRKRISLFVIAINLITVILTYSRTTYLVFTIDLFAIYFIARNASRSIFSVGNFFKYILPAFLCLVWIVFLSPLSANFLESDTDEMYNARMIHWIMALKAFIISPLIGVGINTHLEFFRENMGIVNSLSVDKFYSENPIHNIHLIVLVETGILGFVLWIRFMIGSILKSKRALSIDRTNINAMAQIGVCIAYLLYGMTGWAPFSVGVLPFFLFITYFSSKYIAIDSNKRQNG